MANPMRRKLKNVINQYTDAQVKVREATSNDPWGPSSTLMSEVADLSYNVVAFSEVMQMIWKRLNDSGKNWRHVYKALVLLEYILKTGSEKVAQQCRENIYAIQTLRDFQYIEDNKDQGVNVREKAKQLVILLKDEEKLKQERAKALKAKERFAQNSTAISSTGGMQQSASMTFTRQHNSGSAPSLAGGADTQTSGGRRMSTSDLEQARPSTAGEEELQLQLALAISKEEADAETQKKRGDDVRLALALEESQKPGPDGKKNKRTLVDILGDAQPAPPARNHDDFWSSSGGATATYAQPTRNNDPWASGAPDLPPPPSNDPWGAPAGPPGYPEPAARDPWSGAQTASIATTPADNDPWAPPVAGGSSAGASPWGSPPMPPLPQEDVEFDALMTRPTTSPPTVKDDLDIRPMSMQHSQPEMMNGGRQRSKTPQDFLGGHSGLVDIDNLVTAPKPPARPHNGPAVSMAAGPCMGATNPFAPGAAPSNPFMAQQTAQVRPTLNQMQSQQRAQFAAPPGGAYPNLQQPMMPDQSHNPFM